MKLVLVLSGLLLGSYVLSIPETDLTFLPGGKWKLVEHKKDERSSLYRFQRQSDELKFPVNFSIMVEEIPAGYTLEDYTGSLQPNSIFTRKEGQLQLENAIARTDRFVDWSNSEHRSFTLVTLSKGKGVQFYCEARTEVFSTVENELLEMFKSIQRRE